MHCKPLNDDEWQSSSCCSCWWRWNARMTTDERWLDLTRWLNWVKAFGDFFLLFNFSAFFSHSLAFSFKWRNNYVNEWIWCFSELAMEGVQCVFLAFIEKIVETKVKMMNPEKRKIMIIGLVNGHNDSCRLRLFPEMRKWIISLVQSARVRRLSLAINVILPSADTRRCNWTFSLTLSKILNPKKIYLCLFTHLTQPFSDTLHWCSSPPPFFPFAIYFFPFWIRIEFIVWIAEKKISERASKSERRSEWNMQLMNLNAVEE